MEQQGRLDGFLRVRTASSAKRSRVAGPSVGGKGLATCPVCSRHVPHVLINTHLDFHCSGAEAPAQPSSSSAGQHAAAVAVCDDRGKGGAVEPGQAGEWGASGDGGDDAGASQPEAPRSAWSALMERMKQGAVDTDTFGVRTGLQGGCRSRAVSQLEEGEEEERGATWDAAGARAAGQSTGSGEASGGATPVWTGTLAPSSNLEGHYVLEEFVSEAEEAALLEALDGDTANPWRHDTFNGHSHGKKYGVVCDLYRRVVSPPVHAMPPWLQAVMQRMRDTRPPLGLMQHKAWPLRHFAPNECNAIDYRRATGCALDPHCDDRRMSGDVICNLSLAGDATMTYARERGAAHCVRVSLPRRSLQVQANGVRYNYTHGIANDDLHSARRVSITFRETPLTASTAKPLYDGVRYVATSSRFKWGRKIA